MNTLTSIRTQAPGLSNEKIDNRCKLFDRINEFKEYYKDTRVTSETAEIDKNTVLELCNQMFTQKGNGTAEKENEIKEGDVEQGELIFECFQDEVN